MQSLSLQTISFLCQRALLHEVAVTPKPGLVDRQNSGAHRDMDFYTFLDSAAALGDYFTQIAQTAASWQTLPGNPLTQLRPAGIAAEQKMLEATGGINTHKGAIFSLGILCAAAAYLWQVGGSLSSQAVCTVAAAIAAEAPEDFDRVTTPATTGERLYLTRQISGIRGEAAAGFPSVEQIALPALEEALQRGASWNDACLAALLTLMAQVTDTNIIARGGPEALDWLHQQAGALLAKGGALAPNGLGEMEKLDAQLIARNLSPGGCADLLAAAIFLYSLRQWEERENG